MVSKTTHYRRIRKAREFGCSVDNLPDNRGRHGNHVKGSSHYKWNNESIRKSDGYVLIRVGRGHPLADPNGYAPEHVLVWVAANGRESLAGKEIHHVNGDKADNRLENLQALTHRAHMVADGRLRITDEQVRAIRLGYAGGDCLYDLAQHYGVAMATVGKIVAGKVRLPVGGPIEVRDKRTRGVDKKFVGKKAAGRLLDGREWNEMPEVEPCH